MASSAMLTRSPVVSSMSSSRRLGRDETAAARRSSSSVVWPIADTTTIISTPRRRAAATRSATARIRSGPSTDVPPYLCTSTDMGGVIGLWPARCTWVEGAIEYPIPCEP